MSWNVSKWVALRYLWSRRGEAFITIITWISVIGVAIGVVVINVAMSIMNGFEYELREKILGADSHVLVRKLGGRVPEWQALKAKLAEIEGVKSVSAFTHNQALIRSDGGASGVLIRGIEKGSAAERQLASYLEEGQTIEQLYDPPEAGFTEGPQGSVPVILPGLIVGKELQRTFGIFVGTPVALLSPQVDSSPLGLVPRFKRFMVAGSYRSGLVNYESGMAYTTLEAAQSFFQMGDSVSGIEILAHDIDQAPKISKRVLEIVGGVAAGFYVQDWTEINKPLWDAIKLERNVYFLVLLLIIVMASFSIISTLVMLVMEKRADIAVLRTMGASSSTVGNIFRIQGSVIGGLGTVVGLALSVVACLLLQRYGIPLDERVFQIPRVPVHMSPTNFALVGVAAFGICFLATIYPARRASRLQPAQTLRYE